MSRRTKAIMDALKKEYPNVKCALYFKGAIQLLVAVILSAQCTDKRVNIVTPHLFRRYPTVKDFAEADLSELEEYIRSTGFFRNKARNIKGACSKIVEEFGGKVPKTMEELLTLQGVARKTANVVLFAGFGITAGVVVDTHVIRISNLLGLTKSKNPVVIEKDLIKLLRKSDWGYFSFAIVTHGRQVCIARRPKCEECVLNRVCPSSGLLVPEKRKRARR